MIEPDAASDSPVLREIDPDFSVDAVPVAMRMSPVLAPLPDDSRNAPLVDTSLDPDDITTEPPSKPCCVFVPPERITLPA